MAVIFSPLPFNNRQFRLIIYFVHVGDVQRHLLSAKNDIDARNHSVVKLNIHINIFPSRIRIYFPE